MEKSSQEIFELWKTPSEEWQRIMWRYRSQSKEWSFIPTYLWVILLIASAVAIYYLPSWWNISGVVVGFYSAAQLGSRSGNIDGFQLGYEWGKEQAIMGAFNLGPEQINEIIKNGSEIETIARRENA